MSTSPKKLTSKALGDDIAKKTKELVARARRDDERSLKLDRFMNGRAKDATVRIFYEIYQAESHVTARDLVRRLKIPRRTVYYLLRMLTDEGWLKENVGLVSSWELA